LLVLESEAGQTLEGVGEDFRAPLPDAVGGQDVEAPGIEERGKFSGRGLGAVTSSGGSW
jgi:hypothetical protein